VVIRERGSPGLLAGFDRVVARGDVIRSIAESHLQERLLLAATTLRLRAAGMKATTWRRIDR
jgi:hypothetical protein